MAITLYYQGDFDGTTETASLYDENSNLIGQLLQVVMQCSPTLDSVKFNVTTAQLSNWLADGSIGFSLTPTTSVNSTLCGTGFG